MTTSTRDELVPDDVQIRLAHGLGSVQSVDELRSYAKDLLRELGSLTQLADLEEF